MAHQVTLIEGDGIGPEVAAATLKVIEALKVNILWDKQPAGLAAAETLGEALPEKTLSAIRRSKVALKGPTTTPTGGGHTSANVALRRKLDLYASVRPVRSIEGVESPYRGVDLIIFRENTEGLYAGLENQVAPGVVVSLKVVTEKATRRIAEAAFAHAKKHGRKRVTIIHKANIIKLGDGLFLRTCRDVAAQYPDIVCDDIIIDAFCMRLLKKPAEFEILLTENLYGDILSDLCAGLVGGLGVVPGANLGGEAAVFEAVHGAAPDIAGKNRANPTALMMSAAMMLTHLNEPDAAKRLERAVLQVLREAKVRTGDLGGSASTEAFTQAVIAAL